MIKKLLERAITRYAILKRKFTGRSVKKIDSRLTHFSPGSLLVIANTALGDVLLCTPAIQSLKLSFPQAHISVLINHAYIPLFEQADFIDSIIPYYGGYRKFFSTAKKLENLRADAVLILHGNGPQDIQLALLSGAPYILKHPTKSPLRTHLSMQIERKETHTIDNKLELVRRIGGEKLTTRMKISPLTDSEPSMKFRQFSRSIGFQMGAADIYKMWPLEQFIELAKRLLDSFPDRKIVLTGIEKESVLAEKLIERCHHDKRIINMCGKTTIQELPYLLKELDLLITNDTGTMHLAIAIQTPTLSLFAPTPSKKLGAFQDSHLHSVIQKNAIEIKHIPKKERDNRYMKLISVDEVYKKVKDFITK